MNAPNVAQIVSLTNPLYRLTVAANWKLIGDALAARNAASPLSLIGMAATVLVETAHQFKPIKEGGNRAYFVKHYWDDVKTRTALGNVVIPDSYTYCGRGFIQTTGRHNYGDVERELGLKVLESPDILLQAAASARATAYFWTKHGINVHIDSDVAAAYHTSDPKQIKLAWTRIRKMVNGGTNGLDNFLHAIDVFTSQQH